MTDISIWFSSPSRLVLLFAISIYLSLLLTAGDVQANLLFQSPQSPAAEPPPAQPTTEQAPVEQPPPTQPSIEQPSDIQPSVVQPTVEQPSVEQVPIQQPVVEQSVSEEPLPEPIRPERNEARFDEEGESSNSNLILDQIELVDTVVVSGAYIWLCCGIGLFLIAPLFFLFLQIRGGSKINRAENF